MSEANSNADFATAKSDSSETIPTTAETQETENSNKSMDWQKVAHKLREHNRKLLKKVFKLEQELAEIAHQFQQQSEQSQNSDLLIAQQADEIKKYQQELADFSQKSQISQQKIHEQKLIIDNLTQHLELSQQHTAQLERECTLLQEKCNEKTYEAISQQQKVKELSARLDRQQRYTLEYKALSDKYNHEVAPKEVGHNSPVDQPLKAQNQPIKPWSVAATDEPTLPKTPQKTATPVKVAKAIKITQRQSEKSLSEKSLQNQTSSSSATEWPAPAIAKVSKEKQPQSLAAVELPRFPRQT